MYNYILWKNMDWDKLRLRKHWISLNIDQSWEIQVSLWVEQSR